MKKSSPLANAAILPVLCLLISGCATPQQLQLTNVGATSGPRFHEASAANVVLRFASWDYIFLVRPDYRESDNGFFHTLKRDDVVPALSRLNVPRDVAVVTVGWAYEPQQLNQLVADWKTMLGSCGFRRIVIVRANINYTLDGAIVVEDTAQATSVARQTAGL